jgi:hypothetical protein
MNADHIVPTLAVALALMAVSTQALAAAPARSVQASEARALVNRYFDALESGRYRTACSLLGHDLHAESGGAICPTFLEHGMPSRLTWQLLGTRRVPGGVGVLLHLGQDELDHVRMRTWLAIVRLERGSPRIVETRLLR